MWLFCVLFSIQTPAHLLQNPATPSNPASLVVLLGDLLSPWLFQVDFL